MKRLVVKTTGIVLLVVMVCGLVVLLKHHRPIQADYPKCSVNAPACIRITEHNGTAYGLNDFRFYGQHCIWFVSLPDHVQHTTCDPYKLDWIGA